MRQIEGDRNFVACVKFKRVERVEADGNRPALRTAPVFGGIAGIMAGEQGESDDIGRESPTRI